MILLQFNVTPRTDEGKMLEGMGQGAALEPVGERSQALWMNSVLPAKADET